MNLVKDVRFVAVALRSSYVQLQFPQMLLVPKAPLAKAEFRRGRLVNRLPLRSPSTC
jgi:hypothetical protein